MPPLMAGGVESTVLGCSRAVVVVHYTRELMAGKSFLVLWQTAEAESWIAKVPLGSVGSAMKGLEVNDRIFLTACDGKELFLLGAMRVTGCGIQAVGQCKGKHRIDGKALTGAFQKKPLGGLKWRLRFEGTDSPALSRSKSLLWQVRSRRRLTPASAQLLLDALHDAVKPVRLPSAARYRDALKQIQAQISPLQWRLLESHYLSPNHTASSEDIALAAGKPWRVTNLHYGRLAAKLRRILGQPMAPGEQQSSIIASFLQPNGGFRFWQWVMHPPLAEAIQELAWFGAEDVGTRPFDLPPDGWSALEGERRRTWEAHRRREISLRRAKLEAFRIEHDGRLFCEVPGCSFDFEGVYGALGAGFAEVHHLKPLGELCKPVCTTLADLAVVCANCPRVC